MPYDVTFETPIANITGEQMLPPAVQTLLAAPPPGVRASFRASKGPFPGSLHLRVQPAAFFLLPSLRSVLRRTFSAMNEGVSEHWTPAELASFGLRRHLGPEARGWIQDDPPFVEPTPCPVCGSHVWDRAPREEARFRQEGLTNWGSAIVHPRDGFASAASMVTLMRAELWGAIGEAGLRGTLRGFPVNVAGKPYPNLVALYAPGRLGPKVTPFGCETTCQGCERRNGLYAVVQSWIRPPGADLWWSGVADTGNELYTDTPTWDRVVTLSNELFGKERTYEPPKAYPAGWYESGATNLFLPQHFQAEALS